MNLELAYVVALGPMALVIGLVAVDCKRSLQARWRRFQMDLMKERCERDYAPIFCGRQRG